MQNSGPVGAETSIRVRSSARGTEVTTVGRALAGMGIGACRTRRKRTAGFELPEGQGAGRVVKSLWVLLLGGTVVSYRPPNLVRGRTARVPEDSAATWPIFPGKVKHNETTSNALSWFLSEGENYPV